MTQEPIIQFDQVCKNYGERPVLKDFSLAVERGVFLSIIGRSGCGKTTALKLVNGLVAPDAGRVLVRGEDVCKLDGVNLRRNIGYAIQNVGLFPHMTVEKNIAYVPKISGKFSKEGLCRASFREEAALLLQQVGLDPDLLDRYPRSLSGGQRQRVGIARALAAEPDILLMDEPFGSVDELTRGQLQDEILRIHELRKLTILFVTHDISEAVKLSTHVLVLDQGSIQQYAPPSLLLEAPATSFVEDLVCRKRIFSPRC